MTCWLSRRTLLWRARATGVSPLIALGTRRKGLSFVQSHYTTSATPVEYGYIDGVEYPSYYAKGGYHPVHINDRLDKHYRIVHKLGYGAFSTAWLAVDEKTAKYVAVKVSTADADSSEVAIISQITQAPLSCDIWKDKTSLLPVLLDQFELHGPNGKHRCIVTLPARCSVKDVKEASGSSLFQLEVARSLAAQLVVAVSLVHDKGYAHGDLHLGNLLLQAPSSLDELTIEQLYQRYGQPQHEPVVRLDTGATSTDPGVPSYAVPPVWLGVPSDKITLGEARLTLIDFGVAFRPCDESRFESHSPLILRPPEASFEPTMPLTFASDIWSLGCLLFELLAHRSLIDGFLTPPDEITSQQVELQGPMPPEWWGKWEKRSKWYDEAGLPLSSPSDVWSWERKFEQWVQNPRQSKAMETIDDDERDALLELLGWMLSWRPSERPNIEEVLKADWITKWALPDSKKSFELENGLKS